MRIEARIVFLKRVLDELDIPSGPDMSNWSRNQACNAIYLAQAAGISMNYRFCWYPSGPTSLPLISALHDLYMVSNHDGNIEDNRTLKIQIAERLREMKGLLKSPSECSLTDSEWLSLLTCSHYLNEVIGKDNPDIARAKLRELKPYLAKHQSTAETELRRTVGDMAAAPI